MQLVDKLLLTLLVILLPVGLVASRYLATSSQKVAKEEANQQSQEFEKLAQSISQLGKVKGSTSEMSNEGIPITSVYYASESGVLRVSGIAPNPQLAVRIETTVLPAGAGAAELGEDTSLSLSVSRVALKPKPGGGFDYVYDVVGLSGIVDMRIVQDRSEETVLFDLETKQPIEVRQPKAEQ